MTKTSKNCLGHSKDSDDVDKDEGMVPERVCSWAFRFGLCKEDFDWCGFVVSNARFPKTMQS